MSGARVVKVTNGALPWQVQTPSGAMLRRFPVRRLADGYAALVNGDFTGAAAFYRDLVERGTRRGLAEVDAWRDAAMTVAELSVGPDLVRADRDTGRPLDQ